MYKSRVSKLFLDSRYTLPDGSFEVPGDALELHPDSRCWLGEFTCVASWNTIDATNRELVVIENAVPRTVYIPMGVHDLSSLQTALQNSLNEDVPVGIGGYTVTLVSTANGGSNFRSFLVMAQDGVFKIPPATNTLRNIVNWPDGDTNGVQHTSTFVDVRRTHSIFIHSSFGGYNSIAPTGTRQVLAKIPVNVGYGNLVHQSTSGSEHDCIHVGQHTLSQFRLSLHDAAGIELDLQGTSWSCTLIFEK
jgi:hypothetical protein